MSELPHLVPATTRGFGRPAKGISFAFGRRFFLLLLIGLVWLGPAWNDSRYLYAMAFWDVADVSRVGLGSSAASKTRTTRCEPSMEPTHSTRR